MFYLQVALLPRVCLWRPEGGVKIPRSVVKDAVSYRTGAGDCSGRAASSPVTMYSAFKYYT